MILKCLTLLIIHFQDGEHSGLFYHTKMKEIAKKDYIPVAQRRIDWNSSNGVTDIIYSIISIMAEPISGRDHPCMRRCKEAADAYDEWLKKKDDLTSDSMTFIVRVKYGTFYSLSFTTLGRLILGRLINFINNYYVVLI